MTKKHFYLGLLCLLLISMVPTYLSAQNTLAGTTWIVPDSGDGVNFVFNFNRDGSANFIENERLYIGQYGKMGEITGGMYTFTVRANDGGTMPYFATPKNNTLDIFGETFVLKTGNASNNLAGTVWWVDRNNEGFTLTFTDNVYILERFYNFRGTYSVQNNRVSVNFPGAFSNDAVISGNTIRMGDFILQKQ